MSKKSVRMYQKSGPFMYEINKLKPKIIKILKKYGVKKAGIFGSYARGEQKKKSDVDILAQIPKSVNLYDFIGIKQELEEMLGKKVDLITYNGIRPELRQKILSDEVKII
ncbi:MAG TPA: nucleotidyltransferase family protein [Candidatus Nanoarchaeia archaeon]|nr:nucleotidyltransferase family protein [Candidatus Nanoarchaeia archaeon]